MLNLTKMRSLLDARQAGYSLPQGFYTDPEVFSLDLAAIYERNWIFAGFEAELPEPGCYLSVPIGRSSALIVRDARAVCAASTIPAAIAVRRLCAAGRGQRSWIICPYHQWSYDLDGRLANAPRMPGASTARRTGCGRSRADGRRLHPCVPGGDPPAFDAFRDQFAPLLAPHNLTNAKLAFESTMLMRANWKLVMENARECYHCAVRHPELVVTFPLKGSRSRAIRRQGRFERFRARMNKAGLPVGPVEGEWWRAMRFPLNTGAARCRWMARRLVPS